MKRVILVNGVPASGKSTVARAVSKAGNWPLLTLDTVKEALFAHLGTGDREYNRLLGRASYQAMFDLAADFPGAMTVVMDAWFGFQPADVLAAHLKRAGAAALQIWCHAPPAIIGERYRARAAQRSGGHLGLDYVPELTALAERAAPLAGYPACRIDTTAPVSAERIMAWIEKETPASSR
jgi:predicted kinase